MVPTIVWEHTRRRVLVMEFMEGIKINDLRGLRRAGVDPAWVTRTLVDVFAEQILGHGFFHADPHPGNLQVQPEGPRLVLLDFGLAKELPETLPRRRDRLPRGADRAATSTRSRAPSPTSASRPSRPRASRCATSPS